MRTWEDNKTSINQLWPMAQWSDEERRLWHDDLHGLDQVVLYDALRNVKRSTESLYPQLKWVRDEYRRLDSSRKWSVSSGRKSSEPRVPVVISKDSDAKMRDELRALIEFTEPSGFQETVDIIAGKAAGYEIEMSTAFRLVRYLIDRLGMANGGSAQEATR